MITLKSIQAAQQQIDSVIHHTPLIHSATFSKMCGCPVFFKLENLQKTGSFKIRGAYNKIKTLGAEEQSKGVISASAGNHAQGVALAAAWAGIKSTIVMPIGAALSKVEATKSYGAEVHLHGESFDDALEYAQQLQRSSGAAFIHAFDDPHIIAGQGTIGLEIMAELEDVDRLICPVGGGGLISGIALAMKALKPDLKVVGVEAKACPSMSLSLQKGKPVQVKTEGTIADGIAVKHAGQLTYELASQYVDEMVLVDEIEMTRTMLHLLERSKVLVEGSGAAALAALLFGKVKSAGQKTAVIISGGNVDMNLISRIIERGLVEDGRYVTFSTTVPDKPGYLNQLLHIVAEQQVNIISVHHQRISSRIMPGQTEIVLSLETRDVEHIEQLKQAFHDKGYVIHQHM